MIIDLSRITPDEISSPYGYRDHPVEGVRKFHNGVDVPCPRRSVLVAPFPGVVSWSSTKSGGTQCFLTSTSSPSIKVGFAHLDKVLIPSQSWVDQGEPLALTGNSGVSTGPHVHITVRVNNKLVDPQRLFGVLGGAQEGDNNE